jgi:hypothetical protein
LANTGSFSWRNGVGEINANTAIREVVKPDPS